MYIHTISLLAGIEMTTLGTICCFMKFFIAKLGSLSHVSQSVQTEVTQMFTLKFSLKKWKIFDN